MENSLYKKYHFLNIYSINLAHLIPSPKAPATVPINSTLVASPAKYTVSKIGSPRSF